MMNTPMHTDYESNVEPERTDRGYIVFHERDGRVTIWRRNQAVQPETQLRLTA